MATQDALLSLRQATAANKPPVLSTSSDPSAAPSADIDIALASHLLFTHGPEKFAIPLSTQTRFVSSSGPVDLRSIYFAWQKKDVSIPDYITATQRVNEELGAPNAAGGKIQNLVFVERLDLASWLEGTSDESEYIKPLDPTAAQAQASAQVAAGTTGGIPAVGAAPGASKTAKEIDPRLAEIYSGERKLGDRNSVLRGIKPTDFSHVRKHAESFLGRYRHRPGHPAPSGPLTTNPALVSNLKKPGQRRLEPIILLSPSASSLLRMTNIKQFLETGIFVPADSPAAASSSLATILHIQRTLPSIDPSRPMRFVLVESVDQFKPEYWNRLVAVFTTGQTWQFKHYKWSNPADLFAHALGIYVGWNGEKVPDTVQGWGRGVKVASVDKWSPHQGEKGRWRDREVVEGIWSAIEEVMRARRWGREGFGSGGR